MAFPILAGVLNQRALVDLLGKPTTKPAPSPAAATPGTAPGAAPGPPSMSPPGGQFSSAADAMAHARTLPDVETLLGKANTARSSSGMPSLAPPPPGASGPLPATIEEALTRGHKTWAAAGIPSVAPPLPSAVGPVSSGPVPTNAASPEAQLGRGGAGAVADDPLALPRGPVNPFEAVMLVQDAYQRFLGRTPSPEELRSQLSALGYKWDGRSISNLDRLIGTIATSPEARKRRGHS